MSVLTRILSVLSALGFMAAVTGCGTDDSEPEPEWDYSTYAGQDPIAFTPLPGADLDVWRASIDSLGLGDWGRAEAVDVQWDLGKYAPLEDERISAGRLLWEQGGDLDGSDGNVSFTAQAVTDEAGALLLVYCEVGGHRVSGGAVNPLAWEALAACAAGAANDSIDAAGLEDWIAGVQPTFADRPQEPYFEDLFERHHAGSVQVFLTDDGSVLALSVSVAPSLEGTGS